MTKLGFCKICAFWKKNFFMVSQREHFEKRVRETLSLAKLCILLEGYGLEVSRETVRNHILNHMTLEISEQRKYERENILARGVKKVRQKFWIKPEEITSLPQTCEHPRHKQFQYYDLNLERVQVFCGVCKKLLYSFDPEQDSRRMNKNPRNLAILESLTRRKRT